MTTYNYYMGVGIGVILSWVFREEMTQQIINIVCAAVIAASLLRLGYLWGKRRNERS